MFEQTIPLDTQAHRYLRFRPNLPYHFAAREMLIPVMAGEAAQIAREYPIVFPVGYRDTPAALVGVNEGANAYVQPSGHWQARYVPAHVRRYPFMLADSSTAADAEQGQKLFTIMIDNDAPHLGADEGELLFQPDGKPAPMLEQAQKMLLHLEKDRVRTQALLKQIDETGLLVERILQIGRESGSAHGLKGLRVIDTQRLAECPAETVYALHKSGALALIHAHLISLSNLNDGPLSRTDMGLAPTITDDPFNLGQIDWSKLEPM